MKQFLHLIIIIASSTFAQDKRFENLYDNFSIDNSKVVWQKIYESDLTTEEISNELEKSIIFSPIAQLLKGHTNIFKLTKCVNYGIMPGYQVSDFQAYVEIEIKEGKYRVTVTDIRMNFTSDLYSQPTNTFYPIENYQVTQDGNFHTAKQAKKGLNCINLTFLDIFSIKKTNLKKDW